MRWKKQQSFDAKRRWLPRHSQSSQLQRQIPKKITWPGFHLFLRNFGMTHCVAVLQNSFFSSFLRYFYGNCKECFVGVFHRTEGGWVHGVLGLTWIFSCCTLKSNFVYVAFLEWFWGKLLNTSFGSVIEQTVCVTGCYGMIWILCFSSPKSDFMFWFSCLDSEIVLGGLVWTESASEVFADLVVDVICSIICWMLT